jgi:DNA-binding CsgD family transcriptional regulator
MSYLGVDQSDPAISRVVDFARGALQASASVFYWIDPALNIVEVLTAGMSPRFSVDYHSGIGAGDPLFARRLAHERKKVALLREECGKVAPGDVEPYLALLRDFAFTDTAEMIFWREGIPFAGLGILKRREDPAIGEETIAVASAMQSYLEYSLRAHPHVRLGNRHGVLARRYGLTLREIEVVDLVSGGASNGDIAAILGIGVSTVKTHVLRCFDKLGVKNRAALIAFLFNFD